MRRIGLLLVTVLLVAGCSSSEQLEASKAFCRAADRYDSHLERELEQGKVDLERQIELVAELARTAPPDIEDDAALFFDSLERVEDDPSIRDDPAVREAVDDVNRYANQACGVYDSGGGF
ncbi:MAG: hypothetical protein FJW86_11005 [Actinobacteria bacterium]|nr:hypothetical protein [Actinomycetota bacterium]